MGDKQPNNAKKKQVIEVNNATTKQSHLPDDLIVEEILTRLPVKSILRCKSISKQWYSTLSSSDFANAHLVKSPFSHPFAPVNTLFIKTRENYYLFSYDDDDNQISGSFEDDLVKLDVVFGVELEYSLTLTGCCNGLICLTPISSKFFLLWNPATRKVHKYESDGYLEHFELPFDFPFIFNVFGYASSIDDYKYVRILSMQWGKNKGIIAVHVFSLREQRWRKIDFDIDIYVILYGVGQRVLIHEKLYWVAFCDQVGHVIVSFDLGTEKFTIFPYLSSKIYMLGGIGECLCKFACDESMTDILKPPAVMNSIRLPKELNLHWLSEMIGYTRTGKTFVTARFREPGDEVQDDGPIEWSILALVNLGTEPMHYTALLKLEGSFNIARYVPSLASPFPTPT